MYSWFTQSLTERVLAGADGLVRETISWIARRSFSLCRGLLIPISLWISVSDRLAMMAPLFTLARQAATYQAGIPTHSWVNEEETCSYRETYAQVKKKTTFNSLLKWTIYSENDLWAIWTLNLHITVLYDGVWWCTSSHVTTVGPSHEAKGRPWRQASSNKSCLPRKVESQSLTEIDSLCLTLLMSLFINRK